MMSRRLRLVLLAAWPGSALAHGPGAPTLYSSLAWLVVALSCLWACGAARQGVRDAPSDPRRIRTLRTAGVICLVVGGIGVFLGFAMIIFEPWLAAFWPMALVNLVILVRGVGAVMHEPASEEGTPTPGA